MSETINARIKFKHDVESNWNKAKNFVPTAGELIIYDVDENNISPRFKIGDGTTNVIKLPFSSSLNTYSIATPETLTSLIKSVGDNSTIYLSKGNYDRINLSGNNSIINSQEYIKYPKNLTIIGSEEAKVAGVSITSGVLGTQIANDPDITSAILSANLTFRNVQFTNNFDLRNACVDNLLIDGCHFTAGNYISVNSNFLYSCYGNDDLSVLSSRPANALLFSKNLVIKNCVIENSSQSNQGTGSGDTAIRLLGIDGALIYKNTINGAGFNGINISGIDSNRISKGNIVIKKGLVEEQQENAESYYTYLNDYLSGKNMITEDNKENIKNISKWKDKKRGLSYQLETMERKYDYIFINQPF